MQLGLATEYRTEQMFQRVLAKHFKEMHFNLYRLPKFDKLEWLSMLVKHNLYRAYLGGEDVVRCLPIAVEPGRPLYSRYGMRMSTGGRRQVPHERPGGWVLYWVPREADGKEILRWGFFTWHKERSIWLCDGGAAC
jgi:hypothetical protein